MKTPPVKRARKLAKPRNLDGEPFSGSSSDLDQSQSSINVKSEGLATGMAMPNYGMESAPHPYPFSGYYDEMKREDFFKGEYGRVKDDSDEDGEYVPSIEEGTE